MENDTSAKKIPKGFNWKLYIKLNNDLIDFNNKKAAVKHYIEFGKNENRQFKIDIPNDFNWRQYIKLNSDLKQIANEKDAIYHYKQYGFFENRKYKKDENRIILYDLFINNMIDDKDNLFFILNEIIKKNIKNVFIDNFVKSNISFYEKTKLVFPNIIYNKICNDIQNNLQKYNNVSNDILKYSNMNIMINSEDKNKVVFLDYKFVDFANMYDSFIVIFDLPDNFNGGTKFFINSIIEKYRNKQDFLILCTRENKSIKININNQYYFNTEYNENSIIKILELMQYKIKKIFINHTYGFSKQIINYLFTLNKKVSTITHDHYLFNNYKTQLMYYEINEHIYKNDSFKHDFSLFDNIITQNKKNLYLFKNMSQLDNIIVSQLPDFKVSDELINTNNPHMVVGIIGYISDIKGSDFVRFLIKIFKKSNIKIVIFGKIANSNYKHCYSYNNVNELNELLKTYKPNMLLECSLWPETYSYTLSLSILTDLPILILKKFFSSVVELKIIIKNIILIIYMNYYF
jgi:hypothetical protein